jgi:hypothetical protein
MREVEQRWTTRFSGVDHFEDGLQISVEVDDGTGQAIERQRLSPGIPPSMWDAARQSRHVARLYLDAVATDLRGQSTRSHDALLVFEVMDVHRWALSMRRQGASQLEERRSVLVTAAQLEDLAGMSVLQSKIGHVFVLGDA